MNLIGTILANLYRVHCAKYTMILSVYILAQTDLCTGVAANVDKTQCVARSLESPIIPTQTTVCLLPFGSK